MLRFHLMKIPRARVIAFYLPQFHPIPRERRMVGKRFYGVDQCGQGAADVLWPLLNRTCLPTLGSTDLRLPETRAAQAEMAQAHGIEAFCYLALLVRGSKDTRAPLRRSTRVGEPKFPFCLAWANQTWSGIWHGAPDRILIEQTYPSAADHEAHFNVVLEAFGDERYVRADGKPLFYVYRSPAIPDVSSFY